MSKVKVSHETPFCLLEWSKDKMDYQYCLPHLMEINEEYRNHFLQCKEEGIEIYLDNSLHELGASVSDSLLYKWLEILEPSTFFIPDVWEDKTRSVVNARRWAKIEVPKNTIKTAVVQAKTYHEASICYQTYKDLGYKKIAFSYGASYYNNICKHPNKDFGKAIGRYEVIKALYEDLIIRTTDSIHLLGTSFPGEFGLYKDFQFIHSIDTSNPVMAGIERTRYTDLGLTHKPKANMNNFQDKSLDSEQIDIILYNIKKFKQINNL